MTPLVVVGDIHGDVHALRAMLRRLEPLNRPLVFVGDYVNGGPDSCSVLEELCRHKQERGNDWLFLAGNHDLALLDYLRGGDFAPFGAMGGVATIASYVDDVHRDVHTAFAASFPRLHQQFLETLLPCYEENGVLVSHVGFAPDRPHDRSLEALAKNGSRKVFSSPTPRDLVVCGHYRQTNRKPFQSEHLICIDTGCGMADGPLTAVVLPERTFLSTEAKQDI